jgi:hypothetical protein
MQAAEDGIGTDGIRFSAAMARLGMRVLAERGGNANQESQAMIPWA